LFYRLASCATNSGVARGGADPGRHIQGGGNLLIKNKEFESSSFSLLFFNKILKDLKVPTLLNYCFQKH